MNTDHSLYTNDFLAIICIEKSMYLVINVEKQKFIQLEFYNTCGDRKHRIDNW